MLSIQSKFKTHARAAAIALTLAIGAVGVTPAFAQSEPSFNFNIEIPGGGSMTFGQGGDSRRGGSNWDGGGYGNGGGYGYQCLSNRDVRRGIGGYGFRRVEVTRELRNDRVEVVGQYGNRWYSMRVDKCTGEVDRVERLRRGGRDGY